VLLDGQKQEGANLACLLHAITAQAVAEDVSADDAADILVQWAKNQHLEKQTKPVLLVDECEAILQQCPHRFWERMRGALGRIIWVFSSKQPLDSLYKHHHHQGSPFDNQLKTQWLGLLDTNARDAIIKRGDFNQAQQTLLIEWAGCHPFYLQSLADRLWHVRPKTNEEAAVVLDAFKMEAKRHLNDLWDGLSTKEQAQLQNYIKDKKLIDDYALRSMGVITLDGEPFADVFLNYLQDEKDD